MLTGFEFPEMSTVVRGTKFSKARVNVVFAVPVEPQIIMFIFTATAARRTSGPRRRTSRNAAAR